MARLLLSLPAMSKRVSETDIAWYHFDSREAAWAFMHACERCGLAAGFPGLREYTVEVGIKTWIDRVDADRLSKGAPVTRYAFAGIEFEHTDA